jgi:hypothetical protein
VVTGIRSSQVPPRFDLTVAVGDGLAVADFDGVVDPLTEADDPAVVAPGVVLAESDLGESAFEQPTTSRPVASRVIRGTCRVSRPATKSTVVAGQHEAREANLPGFV